MLNVIIRPRPKTNGVLAKHPLILDMDEQFHSTVSC